MGVHVAQINIGTMVAPTDDPRVAAFMDALERVNAIADAAPGFVWRLQTESGNATEIQIFPDPLTLVNMSVWTSLEVYPLAGLPQVTRRDGGSLAIVTMGPTPYDSDADVRLEGDVVVELEALLAAL